jgi:hypothetical protein
MTGCPQGLTAANNLWLRMVAMLSRYVRTLNCSFAAVYALLERSRAARRAVVGLLAIHTALLAYSGYVHSPTLNEPGHLVAGLSIWKFGRFDVYNVNPPLVKMVAALPVMAAGYNEDWSGFYTGPAARPEIKMGEDFVAANGERSFFLFMIARWACIPFSWIGGIVCYLWARDLYGLPAGVVACSIWCFEPNILAHASLITPDAHATALGVVACYTFWRWLKKPTWSQAALTGAVLGLAELAKTTLILFYPLWPLMWLIYRWPERFSMTGRQWLREGGMLALRMGIGLYVLNLGYGFEGALEPLGGLHFVSDMLTGEERAKNSEHPASGNEPLTANNRFAESWLADLPSPFPKNYLLGVDLQQKDFEHYRPSYLRGEWRDRGWWYYYLYAVAIKVPLGLWALVVIALIHPLGRPTAPHPCRYGSSRARSPMAPEGKAIVPAQRLKEGDSPLRAAFPARTFLRDELILLVPPLVIFAVVSSKTGFSEHMRYVLPCFPCLFVWTTRYSRGLRENSIDKESRDLLAYAGGIRRATGWLATLLALIFLIWSIASSLWIYPHSLSYFNESIGGPLNGSKHLLGSSFDWGQDLRFLQFWVRDNASKTELQLAYYGCFDPAKTCLLYELPPFADTDVQGIELPPGLRALSCSLVLGYPYRVPNGHGKFLLATEGQFAYFHELQPNAFAGYSIAIYDTRTEIDPSE